MFFERRLYQEEKRETDGKLQELRVRLQSISQEAIKLAQALNRKRNFIVEDCAAFQENADELDLKFLHFFRWRAMEWDLFIIESDQCMKKPSTHFYYKEVSKIFSPKSFVASPFILETLLDHFEKGKGLDSLEIKPEMRVFC